MQLKEEQNADHSKGKQYGPVPTSHGVGETTVITNRNKLKMQLSMTCRFHCQLTFVG
jgi:hypothetical protein